MSSTQVDQPTIDASPEDQIAKTEDPTKDIKNLKIKDENTPETVAKTTKNK